MYYKRQGMEAGIFALDEHGNFGRNLNARELEICGLIAKGLSGENIAKLLHLSYGTVRNYIALIYEKTGARNRAQLAARFVAEYAEAATDVPGGAEEAGLPARADAKLRLAGLSGLPGLIPITLTGKPYVIGRFDVSIGRKLCDFEFAKSTKAVSRRHASIEYGARGYAVTDLGSSAGTFVNGNRINPNEPYVIEFGDLLSFGNAGADYIFMSGDH
jgi:DNA-binding CsgD family transcriptional regulator